MGKLIIYVNDIKVNSSNNYVLIPIHLFGASGFEIRLWFFLGGVLTTPVACGSSRARD